MTLEEKNQLIAKGKRLLAEGYFPDSVLESIKEERLRNDIARKIFNSSDISYENLFEKEKHQRKLRLEVKVQFESYLQSFIIFKNISYILLIVGAITWFTGYIGENSNLIFGYLTLSIGFALFLISFSNRLIVRFSLSAALIYTLMYIAELFTIGIPEQFIKSFNHALLTNRAIAIIMVINKMAPFVYVLIKLIIIFLLIRIVYNQKKYFGAKARFENPKEYKPGYPGSHV